VGEFWDVFKVRDRLIEDGQAFTKGFLRFAASASVLTLTSMAQWPDPPIFRLKAQTT
jgi:hypothetical protein